MALFSNIIFHGFAKKKKDGGFAGEIARILY
jgi:hypothetical protein